MGIRQMGRPSAFERFMDKVLFHPSGCWIFTGGKVNNGYGTFWDGKKTVLAHRWAYEHFVGPIPPRLTLDHGCRRRACVSPLHVEPLSNRRNTLRGNSPAALNHRKTHCPKGHPYDKKNIYVWANRYGRLNRQCRACRRERYQLAKPLPEAA